MKNKTSPKPLSEYGDALTVSDIQEILCIGRKQVYKLIENGDLYAVRPGRSFIISKVMLQKYLNGDNANK